MSRQFCDDIKGPFRSLHSLQVAASSAGVLSEMAVGLEKQTGEGHRVEKHFRVAERTRLLNMEA